jgi:hypothetical protein
MNRNKLKTYAPQARREFIKAVTDRAAFYGLSKKKIEPVTEQGDVAVIGGKAFPKSVAANRKLLEQRIAHQGFEQVMEAMAYTWFNRFVAIRYMELHGYLDHGYRVLSNPDGSTTPEIIEHAEHVDLPGLKKEEVIELKLEGNKEADLYDKLLLAQCHALHKAMPFLFEPIDDETELLLPDNLLHSDSLIRTLVGEIPEEDWQEVEIIGWLYQFYISEKKDQVIGKVVKSEDIPAATQLFTPNWIVKYLVQNSLGRQWVATYPNSPLKGQMEYYIEPAEQTPEVQEQLKAITPESLNPEELTLLDPACGSGHILVEAYDLLKAIYQERGYPKKDIPRLILTKNLYGLEIDDRAAQLAAFALMMKARADDRRIFAQGIQPHVLSIQESKGLDAKEITEALNAPLGGNVAKGDISQADVAHLIDLFEHGKTFGSLIQVPERLAEKLPAIAQRVEGVIAHGGMFEQAAARAFKPLVKQARLLSVDYDAVVANPPYMGRRNGMNGTLKSFINSVYPACKADIYAAFLQQGCTLSRPTGSNAMVTMQSWMFLSSYHGIREEILRNRTVFAMAHLGPRAFNEISGEVVQVTASIIFARRLRHFHPTFFRLVDGDSDSKQRRLLASEQRWDTMQQEDFLAIPDCPITYWLPPRIIEIFSEGHALEQHSDQRQGLATGDDDSFIRCWHEVPLDDTNWQANSFPCNRPKWYPFIKGGSYRKWYGNNEHVICFDSPSFDALSQQGNALPSRQFYLRESLVWSDITSCSFGARYNPSGKVFATGALSAFPKSPHHQHYVLGYLNSVVHNTVMAAISSGIHYSVGYVDKSPYIFDGNVEARIEPLVSEAIDIARNDWDDSESSWDFASHPMLRLAGGGLVKQCFRLWQESCGERIARLKEIEEEINSEFLELYGLADDLSVEVPADEIALYRPDREEDIQRLISYAIGCMMGRYSLEKPGLIYAHSGGEGFDPGQYQTFPADSDGIIPITEFEWFEDDAANRLEEFIATAWPKDHLEENLNFIAESIGQKKSESARDVIRRYLSTGFYKHHLSLYKKRPIYWLFSSGKQRAFQCLVYLHRYNAGTLSRMRTEYVIPLQGKIESRIDQLALDIEAPSSTSHQKKLTKERDTLVKHREELQTFDEKLRHYADQRITLDLDDGVKVNYGKFGDLLAEVKAITGQKPEE